jgi:hypothetical protein
MLHLAEVIKNIASGELELHLLACQKSESQWSFDQDKYIALNKQTNLKEGLLILVELSEDGKIIRFREAKNWILNLIGQYLTKGSITPNFIAEEQIRIEQWRQELTVKSQELTRIRLELELRREELQQLENNLHAENAEKEANTEDTE